MQLIHSVLGHRVKQMLYIKKNPPTVLLIPAYALRLHLAPFSLLFILLFGMHISHDQNRGIY